MFSGGAVVIGGISCHLDINSDTDSQPVTNTINAMLESSDGIMTNETWGPICASRSSADFELMWNDFTLVFVQFALGVNIYTDEITILVFILAFPYPCSPREYLSMHHHLVCHTGRS